MKVLVTGASGLLGRQIFKKLQETKLFDVTGTCFSRTSNTELTQLDITNEGLLTDWLHKHQPEAIVHCAAERRPDIVENSPAKAASLNVDATKLICDLANKARCWVLYISTDYVFDGKNAPYKESDQPNPLNRYGQMKLAGEQMVLSPANELRHAVLRVPILYGPVEYLGESAVTILYTKVKDTASSCTMDHRQRRYPTHVSMVADVVQQMLTKHQEKPFSLDGIYHLTDSFLMTKYDMAVAMAEAMNHSAGHINADTSEPSSTDTPRPYDCHMRMDRLKAQGVDIRDTPFSAAIREILTDHLKMESST